MRRRYLFRGHDKSSSQVSGISKHSGNEIGRVAPGCQAKVILARVLIPVSVSEDEFGADQNACSVALSGAGSCG